MMSSTYPGKHGMGGCWDRQEVCRYVDVLFAASPFAIPPCAQYQHQQDYVQEDKLTAKGGTSTRKKRMR